MPYIRPKKQQKQKRICPHTDKQVQMTKNCLFSILILKKVTIILINSDFTGQQNSTGHITFKIFLKKIKQHRTYKLNISNYQSSLTGRQIVYSRKSGMISNEMIGFLVIKEKRMDLISGRKDSQQLNSESEDQIGNLFPKTQVEDLEQVLSTLKEHYNKKAHGFELTNYCYRCHIKQLVDPYTQFKNSNHPQLQEPRISSFYDNSVFVDLRELTNNWNGTKLELTNVHIPPIPKNLHQILNRIFKKHGCIPNFQRFLLFYPTYLEKHTAAEEQLFGGAKLESKIAYFLAFVAAAELGSAYIMSRTLKFFLKEGGMLEWIEGKFPAKYRVIFELNRFMARAPWQITSQMLEDIIQNGTYHWSKQQLAICIQIFAFGHQMATISLGAGLFPEDEEILRMAKLSTIFEMKNRYDCLVYESSQGPKEKLASVIPSIREMQQEESAERLMEFKQELVVSKKTLKKTNKKADSVDNYMKQIGNQLTKQELYKQIYKQLEKVLPPFQIFEKRGEQKNNTFEYADFNYQFNAYPMLKNSTSSNADRIEALISYSQTMTRNNFGSQTLISTKNFLKAVRFYSENLCGYTHMQYDYKNNDRLPMPFKFYIRLLTLSPININRQVIRQINHQSGQVQCFDLGHLAVLIASIFQTIIDTKMSLELTLTVRALLE